MFLFFVCLLLFIVCVFRFSLTESGALDTVVKVNTLKKVNSAGSETKQRESSHEYD